MSITIRPARSEDLDAILQVDAASFGDAMAPEDVADAFTINDIGDFRLAVDDDRVVGVAGSRPFSMHMPGGDVDVAGVTWVSVDVTYRRRGVLTQLMRTQLTELRDAGLPAAILLASESGIYGRFGYGAATLMRKTEIHRRRVSLVAPGDPRNVDRVTKDEARKRLPEIHERWRAQTPGAVNRSDAVWDAITADRESRRDGMSPLFHLVHEDGYVSYRIKSEWSDGDPRHLCGITDYAVNTPQAHRDLWSVLLGLDLIGTIESYRIPMDDPLPYIVNDPRQVRTTHVGDGLWLRPLDVAALLSSRAYAVDVDVVVAVVDDLFGNGTYRLTGGPEGAECAVTDAAADITLDAATLGALSIGGMRVQPLAEAGRVSGDEKVLRRLDRALLADRAPAHGTNF